MKQRTHRPRPIDGPSRHMRGRLGSAGRAPLPGFHGFVQAYKAKADIAFWSTQAPRPYHDNRGHMARITASGGASLTPSASRSAGLSCFGLRPHFEMREGLRKGLWRSRRVARFCVRSSRLTPELKPISAAIIRDTSAGTRPRRTLKVPKRNGGLNPLFAMTSSSVLSLQNRNIQARPSPISIAPGIASADFLRTGSLRSLSSSSIHTWLLRPARSRSG